MGWYQRFIPNFSDRAAGLTGLTRKSSPQKVKLVPECEAAFEHLKQCMYQKPVLQSPDISLPVQYISRTLFPRQTRYSTADKVFGQQHTTLHRQQHTTLHPTAGLHLKLSRVGPGWETRSCRKLFPRQTWYSTSDKVFGQLSLTSIWTRT